MEKLSQKFKQWAEKNKQNLPNKKNEVFVTILSNQKEIFSLLKEGFNLARE